MKFLSTFIEKAKKKQKIVAIGLADKNEANRNIIQAAQKVASATNSKILLVGNLQSIQLGEKLTQDLHQNIDFVSVSNPSLFLIKCLFENEEFKSESKNIYDHIDCVVRGGISSSAFVKSLRKHKERVPQIVKVDGFNALTYRLALLEPSNGEHFFYAPVGIDEANTYMDKKNLIELAIKFFKKIDAIPDIAILSGGRLSDVGRDPWIDGNIEEAVQLTSKLQKDYPDIKINHFEILIERAIKRNANIILAPEGIAGNLIYRTLVHLGNGRSYGAIYLSYYIHANKVIIDTSRAAKSYEYEGALYMALGID
jgi:predicted methyltransferase MtxX (methanogen marker protein 4)